MIKRATQAFLAAPPCKSGVQAVPLTPEIPVYNTTNSRLCQVKYGTKSSRVSENLKI